jgi:uncharacterized protein YceH (UPF0502 family)
MAMTLKLTPTTERVLGALIEKQMSTPDTYPLTLNALVNACNQKTNRDPVLGLDVETVQTAVDALRQQRLVWQVMTQGSRVPKYEVHLDDVAIFNDRQLAILCELLLRGQQTPGELRTHTARLTDFPAVAAVERALQTLSDHDNGPFVVKLPRQPGHKENRYRHLLGSEEAPLADKPPEALSTNGRTRGKHGSGCDRLTEVASRLDALQAQVDDLARALTEFKAQFE